MKIGIFLSYIGLGSNLLHLTYCHQIAKKYGPVSVVTICKNLEQALEDDPLIKEVIYIDNYYKKIFDIFDEERAGLVPTTKWKLKNIGKGWVLGETLLAGIGQGYFLTTPMQLCLMSAQMANGGYEIKPKIIYDEQTLQPTIDAWRAEFNLRNNGINLSSPLLKKLYRNLSIIMKHL